MDKIFILYLLDPVLMAAVSAAATYFVIIRKTRTELAAQTRTAFQAFQQAADAADTTDRNTFQTQVRELWRKVMECETDKVDMIARLENAHANLMILETRLQALERMAR
ncbi:MAG TPA: hypothetical protein VHY57_11555 [Rhizomicrobium sp.]|nr:hypothetical protein [Rhizomicrobium sp.]